MNIQNIFQKEIFYDSFEYQDISTDEVFEAGYKYGPEEEQIVKKNIIINFFQTLLARLFQVFIYPGASFKLDENRFFKTKHQLKAIGGRFINLKTPDGDTIEAVHLKATDFKKSIEKYFDILEKKNMGFSSEEIFFTIKPEFCIEEKKESNIHLVPNEEAKTFIEFLEKLKLASIRSEADLPYSEQEGIKTDRKKITYLQSFYQKKVTGLKLGLHSLPASSKTLPILDEKTASSPTVIITGGNNSNYGMYKTLAAGYLMRGIDVMLIHPRGYGNSTGIPSSYKTNLDLETAYQYLSQKQKVEDKDILLHGHCIGGGISADFAARRQKINILIDRSFSKFSEQAETIAKEYVEQPIGVLIKKIAPKNLSNFIDRILPDKYNKQTVCGKIRNKLSTYAEKNNLSEKLSKLFVQIVSSSIVFYDTQTNLKKIKGKIALVIDEKDSYINKDAEEKLLLSCKEKIAIHTNVGHSPMWLNFENSPEKWFLRLPSTIRDYIRKRLNANEELIKDSYDFSEQFNQFLIEANLYRKVF